MRYAEVLLSYLEALNEASPAAVTQQVLDQTINQIRGRVNLPGLKKAELSTQEDVRQAVRQERRVELAFEGLRYFDVLTSSLRTPKVFVKEFSYFLMPCH